MNKTVFEPGKEYRTRDGRRARVYATDGGGSYPIHGAVLCADDGWVEYIWELDGQFAEEPHDADLIPTRPPVVVSDAVERAYVEGAAEPGMFEHFRPNPYVRAGLAAAIAAYLDEQEAAR